MPILQHQKSQIEAMNIPQYSTVGPQLKSVNNVMALANSSVQTNKTKQKNFSCYSVSQSYCLLEVKLYSYVFLPCYGRNFMKLCDFVRSVMRCPSCTRIFWNNSLGSFSVCLSKEMQVFFILTVLTLSQQAEVGVIFYFYFFIRNHH